MTYFDPDQDDEPDFSFDAPDAPPLRRRRGRHARHAAEPSVDSMVEPIVEPSVDSMVDPAAAGPVQVARPEPVPSTAAMPPSPPPTHSNGRAGRDLPAAIAVGIVLSAAVIGSLLMWPPAFLFVVIVAVAIGTVEMTRAAQNSGARAPLAPLLVAGPVLVGLAWFGGSAGLLLGLVATVLAAAVWRLATGVVGYQRDVAIAALIITYVPFMACFAVLLVRPEADGHLRVLVTLAAVVLSDTGGYVTGVLFGRRPMAPTVSPKKSWEGLIGSLVCAAAGSSLLLSLGLDVVWWQGAVFGAVVSGAAVLGDLAESLLKRDLGVKDMSNLLPGHGGLMDRLDSILLAAPAGYGMLALIAPVSL